jgi:hypothetical protein
MRIGPRRSSASCALHSHSKGNAIRQPQRQATGRRQARRRLYEAGIACRHAAKPPFDSRIDAFGYRKTLIIAASRSSEMPRRFSAAPTTGDARLAGLLAADAGRRLIAPRSGKRRHGRVTFTSRLRSLGNLNAKHRCNCQHVARRAPRNSLIIALARCVRSPDVYPELRRKRHKNSGDRHPKFQG